MNRNIVCKTTHPAKDDSGEMFVIVGLSTYSKAASSCRWTSSKNMLIGRIVALLTSAVIHTRLVPFVKTLQQSQHEHEYHTYSNSQHLSLGLKMS